MTVTNTTARNQYTATAGQTVFAYTFEVYNKNDLVVLKNSTTLSEGSNYTVSGVGSDSGGNITLAVGATAGDVITQTLTDCGWLSSRTLQAIHALLKSRLRI